MTKIANWDAVPDSDVKPKGIYQVEVESYEETESQSGLLMYKTMFRIQEPSEFGGMILPNWFCVGSKDKPDEFDPSTPGARDLKKFFKAVGVPLDPDLGRMWSQAEQGVLLVSVDARPSKNRDGSEGPIRNNITNFFGLGERVPKVETELTAPAGAGRLPSSNGRARVPKGMSS